MADISREIRDFREAVYGEEVRGSMISLAEKVNKESSDSRDAAQRSAESSVRSERAAEQARDQAATASQNADQAAESANAAAKEATDGAFAAREATGEALAAAQSANDAVQVLGDIGEFAQSKIELVVNASDSAAASAGEAKISEANAGNHATNAANSAEVSEDYAKRAQSYAVGTDGKVRPNDNEDSAKGYYEKTKHMAQGVNGIIPMGTIAFENLPTGDDILSGAMYNISNVFTSDERFTDGGGTVYGAGSNVYWIEADQKWDVTASSAVYGVKGGKEAEYRQGMVNITADDIGAVGTGGDISSNTVTFEQAAERAGITSGDTMSVAFGKLAKYCADLESGVLNGLAGNVQNQLDLGALRLKKDLGTAGWYRILFFGEGIGSAGPVSPSGISVDLTLCRNYNYSQAETVVMTIETGYSEPPICVVHDRNAYDTHQAFRDIRIVWDPESKGCWLEIFYNTNQTNTCSAYLSVKDAYLSNFRDRVVNFDPVETTDVTLIWQYSIPITKDVKTNGLRKIYTGDINIDDYFDAAHVGSYGHHSGTLSGIPSGLSGVGVWDTEYSIGDGDSKYLKQTYSPYDKSIFAQRIKRDGYILPWDIFYPGRGTEAITLNHSSKITIYNGQNYAYKIGNVLMFNALFTISESIFSGEVMFSLPDSYRFLSEGQLMVFGTDRVLPIYVTRNSRNIQMNGTMDYTGDNEYFRVNGWFPIN